MTPVHSSPSLRPILILGSTGQLGATLIPVLSQINEVVTADRAVLDFNNAEKLREYVCACRPSVILNAAAYTAVDKAESEHDLARAVNATAPGVLAQAARKTDALLIHYSTDYVFDGTKPSPYVENDPVNPLNVYGRTKAEGELAIQKSGCRLLIFRTSWVYSERGANFLLTMLRLARQRDELRIVDDQIGAPTSTHSLARATAEIVQRYCAGEWQDGSGGLYHMTDRGSTSWFGFAKAILERASKVVGTPLPRLVPITSADYPTAARRPLNSVLSCEKLHAAFGILMPNWEDSLDEVLHAYSSASTQTAAR